MKLLLVYGIIRRPKRRRRRPKETRSDFNFKMITLRQLLGKVQESLSYAYILGETIVIRNPVNKFEATHYYYCFRLRTSNF